MNVLIAIKVLSHQKMTSELNFVQKNVGKNTERKLLI